MGGPYPTTIAALGGLPTNALDTPIDVIFLILFMIGAAIHMTIFQVNNRRGQKFIMSGMTFGFCMARISANVMRIVWANYPHKVSIAIAAQIFVAAGVVLLFVINMIFVERVIRASHPHLGWHKTISLAFRLFIGSIVAVLIALITCVIQSFFTLDPSIKIKDRDVQRFGSIYFAVVAFMPLVLLALRAVIPIRGHVEKFGTGRFRTKIWILVFSSSLLTLGAAFRAAVSYMPRPITNPAWYHSKACFYLFNFTIEITIVYLYAFMRMDKRFIVPNGSHGAGDYSRKTKKGEYEGDSQRQPTFLDRVMSEEEVFDGEAREERWKGQPTTDVNAQHVSSEKH
ncbi:hypothetical protein BJ878DRAFT_20175 [Calycina marina]|uniref:Uncharacterized protein n=1 Tax=Calycina marina TaxID=1763456 RepID=A0A9P7YUC8_9HELO|nr:hypothetical protein BJ878DRAFT_20175 [Calycina marina]